MGAKKRPFYRVVVADARSPRDGKFIETIGHYNPLTEPATIVINEERGRYWLSVGAQPTTAVSKLMKRAGLGPDAVAEAPAPEPSEPAALAQERAQTSVPLEAAPSSDPADAERAAVEPSAEAQQVAQTVEPAEQPAAPASPDAAADNAQA